LAAGGGDGVARALLLTAGILLYGLGALDLIHLLILAVLRLVLGCVYLIVCRYCLLASRPPADDRRIHLPARLRKPKFEARTADEVDYAARRKTKLHARQSAESLTVANGLPPHPALPLVPRGREKINREARVIQLFRVSVTFRANGALRARSLRLGCSTMLARFLCGAALLLVGGGLCGCFDAVEGQVDEQKNPYFIHGPRTGHGPGLQGAIDAFEKALEVNPHSALAHFELGVLTNNTTRMRITHLGGLSLQAWLRRTPIRGNAKRADRGLQRNW